MDGRVAALRDALASHPAVTEVRLVGSRAEGRAHELSDWDLYVKTGDFERVAADLPAFAEPAAPLARQWDPYSSHACYMLMLPGPTKVDVCFFDEPHEWAPAWEARPDTLVAIDRHFWDWILWLEQKRRGGKAEQVEKSLRDLFELLLRPLGVDEPPATLDSAVRAYVEARARLERDFGVAVPRDLEQEVRPIVEGA